MRRHRERKKGKEKRREEGRGGERKGRDGSGEHIQAKRERQSECWIPFNTFFFFSLLGRRKRWLAVLVTGLESFSDLANSVFALD